MVHYKCKSSHQERLALMFIGCNVQLGLAIEKLLYALAEKIKEKRGWWCTQIMSGGV